MKSKKYVTEDGDYLLIEQDNDDLYRIYWYIKQHDAHGLCLGESQTTEAEATHNKDEWEVWQAERCAEPFADGTDMSGMFFETQKSAKQALKAANEGLLSGEKPWPAWAYKAKAAGWTPPEDWKP